MYDIREPIYYISLNKNVEFIDEDSQLFYNELDKYAIFDEDEGIDIDEAKEKEYYSDGVTEVMYTDEGVIMTNWKDEGEEIKEIIENDELVEKSIGTKRDWAITRHITWNYYTYKSPVVTSYNFTSNFKHKYIRLEDVMSEQYRNCKVEDIPLNLTFAITDKVIKRLILRDSNLMNTNEEKICIFNVHWTDDGMIDDIEYYIVPEDKMHLSYEEMYQLAFND